MDAIIFIIQIITGVVILYLIYLFLEERRSVLLSRRFEGYSVEVLDDNTISFSDRLVYHYKLVREELSKLLIKIKIFNTYSSKYQKYTTKSLTDIEKMNYISDKIFIGIMCVLLLLISCLFKEHNLSLILILMVFLIGFFLLDIYLYINHKIYKKKIDEDMNKAIIIMNNAFKSGYSIMQAIYLVYTELDGPISLEFKKMYMDINYGLSMDVVFDRFAKRVDNVDARYMATSLSVVNTTGGNIVQVFSSVEKNSLVRKKLHDELDSVSAASQAMFKVLVGLPILYLIILLIINPTYFTPLFTTGIGIMCLLISIILYVTYIFIIRKIIYTGDKL